MGVALAQAQSWLAKRREDLPVVDRNFIDQSTQAREQGAEPGRGACRPSFTCCWSASSLGSSGWINQAYIEEQVNWYLTMRPYMVAQVRPYVLSREAERALKPGQLSGNAPRTAPRWSSCRRANS